jgi:hypothetical protein
MAVAADVDCDGNDRSVAAATMALPSRHASALSNRVNASRRSCASSAVIR